MVKFILIFGDAMNVWEIQSNTFFSRLLQVKLEDVCNYNGKPITLNIRWAGFSFRL